MGIEAELKQISLETLDLLRQDPALSELFFEARWLPESSVWSNWIGFSNQQIQQNARKKFNKGKNKLLKDKFLQEWEIGVLDLHKYFQQLSFLLAGYIFGYVTSQWTISELMPQKSEFNNDLLFLKPSILKLLFQKKEPEKDFLAFLVINNSEWDGLPLVNAIGAGQELNYKMSYGLLRYLLPNEVEVILNGLINLSEKGFQERYKRESQKTEPCPWIDWEDEDTIDCLTDYYNEMVSYYQDAVAHQKAMLLYLC